jgi:hypothetical protein
VNEQDLQVTIELDDDPAVTASEMQLLADLLPELVKDIVGLQEQHEE